MKTEWTVEDMSCGHCVQTITKAVKASDPGALVQTDLDTHQVVVDNIRDPDAIEAAIREAGYQPVRS